MLRIILSGCMGKMGHSVMQAVSANDSFEICAGVDKMASTAVGYAFPVYNEITKVTEKADVIIDFSRPDSLPLLLRYAQSKHIPLVLASTGYNKNDYSSIEFAAENIPIMCSSNYSLGVNVLKQLCATAASTLHTSFDIEIVEKHHSAKVDSPSGTAMMLADTINDAVGGDLEYIYDRHERSSARPKRELGISAVRGGTITGEHTVIFAGMDEVIELTHRAYSRNIFTVGALKAAEFIQSLPCGLYNMSSLLTQQQIITHAYCSETDVIISIGNITDSGKICKIFNVLKEDDIMVDVISQPMPQNGIIALSFSVSKALSEKAERVIKDVLDNETFDIRDDITKIIVEGSGMEHHAGATGKVLNALSDASVPVLLITTSETKITLCVPTTLTQAALKALNECLTISG